MTKWQRYQETVALLNYPDCTKQKQDWEYSDDKGYVNVKNGKQARLPLFARAATLCHANLNATTRNWPFSELGFWDKNTGICASATSYRRDFLATIRI